MRRPCIGLHGRRSFGSIFKTVKEKTIDLQKKRSFAVKVDDAMNFSVYQFCILNEIYLQVIVNAIVREFIEANIYEGRKILI